MRSVMALGGGLVLLVAMVVYAGQRQSTDRAIHHDEVKRAVQQRLEKPGIHTLRYEGPARVVQSTEAIHFSPGEEPLQLIMGFRIDWNKHTMLSAPDRMTRPGTGAVAIAGWLNIAFDPESGLLDVVFIDDSGRETREAYQPMAFRTVDPLVFAEFMDEFFQFMNTDTSAAAGAVAAARLCTCSCNFGRNKCATSLVFCDFSKCGSCTCSCNIPNQTCSCECAQTI